MKVTAGDRTTLRSGPERKLSHSPVQEVQGNRENLTPGAFTHNPSITRPTGLHWFHVSNTILFSIINHSQSFLFISYSGSLTASHSRGGGDQLCISHSQECNGKYLSRKYRVSLTAAKYRSGRGTSSEQQDDELSTAPVVLMESELGTETVHPSECLKDGELIS